MQDLKSRSFWVSALVCACAGALGISGYAAVVVVCLFIGWRRDDPSIFLGATLSVPTAAMMLAV